MSAIAIDLRQTAGFLVADARGRVVGTVECPMYGTSPETPDALSVRSGWLARRRLDADPGQIGTPYVRTGRELEDEIAFERLLSGATLLPEKLHTPFAALHCAPTPCIEQTHIFVGSVCANT